MNSPYWTLFFDSAQKGFVESIKTKSVPALDRALQILEMLANSKTGLTLAEITRNLGLAKSSAHYLLLTLVRRGYLHRNRQTGRYMFGLKLFTLANMALGGLELRQQAAPFLIALGQRTELTINMAILDLNEVVLIEKVEPRGIFRLATWVGQRLPVHCTGLGKALLAFLPEPELDRIIKHGLLRHNENTIVSPRKLKEHLALVRKLGYAVDDEEANIGLRGIGAPVQDSLGQAIASISVSGTTTQITPENLASFAEKVKQTGIAISQQLGFDPRAEQVQSGLS
jgi:DNA-binding IclR family transcriptional regulator